MGPNSARLNSIELQRGQTRQRNSSRGTRLGQLSSRTLIPSTPSLNTTPTREELSGSCSSPFLMAASREQLLYRRASLRYRHCPRRTPDRPFPPEDLDWWVSGNGFSLSLAQDASSHQTSERRSRKLQSSCCLLFGGSSGAKLWKAGGEERTSLAVLSIRFNGPLCQRQVSRTGDGSGHIRDCPGRPKARDASKNPLCGLWTPAQGL
jgi:hypothetical protein